MWPPSATVRQSSMARMTFRCESGKACVRRYLSPYCRKMSASSYLGFSAAALRVAGSMERHYEKSSKSKGLTVALRVCLRTCK